MSFNGNQHGNKKYFTAEERKAANRRHQENFRKRHPNYREELLRRATPPEKLAKLVAKLANRVAVEHPGQLVAAGLKNGWLRRR